MEAKCGRCGSITDVRFTGDAYVCASCLGEAPGVDPHLQFIRWAVEHGKVTDFPGKVDELYEVSSRGKKS